jgi:hypothetical protein
MKKHLLVSGAIVFLVLVIASCSLVFPDTIIGNWQQVSVGGVPTVLLTVVSYTATAYSGTLAGVATNSGTWTKSGNTYSLNGSYFGLVGTSSKITPVFSNSNNTMTYTDSASLVEVWNRQ